DATTTLLNSKSPKDILDVSSYTHRTAALRTESRMCRLSWFLDPGGWSKAVAIGLYFIFLGICTLSLDALSVKPFRQVVPQTGCGNMVRYGKFGPLNLTEQPFLASCERYQQYCPGFVVQKHKRAKSIRILELGARPLRLDCTSSPLDSISYPLFAHDDLGALAHKIPPLSLSLSELLELCLDFGCGSLHLLPSVTGEKLWNDS
ncbi:hypothetical protein STEG23_028704, partial [Scotinomys teguina]